jgi:two-component system sensor kinase FixL
MRAPQSQSLANSSADQQAETSAATEHVLQPTSGQLIVVLDHKARIVSFDQAFSRFIGKEPEVLRGADFVSLVVPKEDRDAFAGEVSAAIEGSESDARVSTWRANSGEAARVQWWLSRLDAGAGNRREFAITAVPMFPNPQAWDRLAEIEARLQSLLDTAVDGVCTIDEQGVIESLNPATEQIFGYESGELIGRNLKILMPEPYQSEHDSYISRYLSTGEKKIIGVGREVEGRRKDGSIFPLDLSVSEFQVAGKRRFMGLMRDISERKRAEHEARRRLDELAHASRLSALGEMATGIAHEVNQPLAAIVSYAQACLNLLNSESPDTDVMKDALTQITAQGRRAGEIVHHLRQLVRKDQAARTELDLNECVRSVLNLFTGELKSSGVSLSLELVRGIPRVRADRVQIEQVLLNLIRNALDVMEDQADGSRQLFISTRFMGHTGVEVCVRDTGPGLGGDDPERLFETFYTTKPSGLGVGLSISRSIISSHGGRLWAKENRDRGLSVHFILPGRHGDE